VTIAGEQTGYDKPLIQLHHSSEANLSYYSNYMHISKWVVTKGEQVEQGALIGYSGVSASGDAHLHFEIRTGGHWQCHAVHPLTYLPYADNHAKDLSVTIEQVDTSTPRSPTVRLRIRLTNLNELDFNRVALTLSTKGGEAITQTGASGVGQTPEGRGYAYHPPYYDMTQTNRDYSYLDSYAYPWESFLVGGAYESPYASQLPATYSANIHLDQASATNPSVGLFNGHRIAPAPFSLESHAYEVAITFEELNGTSDPSQLCVEAVAYDIHGYASPVARENCL